MRYFMSNSILQILDRKLKEIGNRTLAFGEFLIIFSGDFCQLKPVGSNEKRTHVFKFIKWILGQQHKCGDHIKQ